MDETQFLRGLEGEEQQGTDLVAGAEHLVRLKIQTGQPTQTRYEDLELTKEARIFGANPPNTAEHAAIPYKTREKHYREYVDAKSKEEPTGYLKGIGGGALAGGGLGALTGLVGAIGNRHLSAGQGALAGGVAGAIPGALMGAILAKVDKNEIKNTKETAKKKNYGDAMAHHIGNSLENRRSADWWDDERRHMELLHKRAADKLASPKEKLRHLIKTNPVARAAAINAIAGGTIGAATGALANPGQRVEGAAVGGVSGAALGAASGGLQGYLQQKLAMDWDRTMMLGTMGAGALAGGLGTYLGSREDKETGKSKMEKELEGRVAANSMTPEDGLLQKLHNRNTEHQLGYAKALKEHPVKGSLLGALMGASAGYGLGRLGGVALKAVRGGK